MRKVLASLGLAASLAAPASLEALMIMPCYREALVVREVPSSAFYTVQKEDTLWKISEKMYGTPEAYGAIASLNNPTLTVKD